MLIDEDNFNLAMLAVMASDEVAVDTETSGLNVRNKVDYCMGICLSVEGFEGYAPFRHKVENLPFHYLYMLFDVLKTKDLIWHNQKFDWHSLATLGINPLEFTGKQYDTLILAQLVNEEWYSKELDYLGKMLLHKGKINKEIHQWAKIFGYENLPVGMMVDYGSQDAVVTRELKDYLWPRIVKQELESVYWETEQPFLKILFQMEQRGVGVNTDFCKEKAYEGNERLLAIEQELGFKPSSPIALGNYLLNELGLPILAHTDSCQGCKAGLPVEKHEGKPSFNKAAMEHYDDILQESHNPAAQLVAEYRGWQKAVASLYEPLLTKTGPDGFIRTNFRQTGTVTGRISAADPNLQQVPRGSSKPWNGNAKYAFNSGREGFTLIGWDYSQLELRLAAAYGREQLLLAEFEKEKADPFSALAPRIFGVLTPETRQDTKTFVYANLYGAGLKKIAAQLDRPLDEVEELYENYKATIPGIMAISKQVSDLITQRGFIRYWDGRRRHMKNKKESYKAWNSLCQGGGSQLVKKAMMRCKEFEDENCFMVMQVHDEITFCIRTEMIPDYEPKIVKAMTDFPEFGVHFHVEGKEWK